MMKFCEAVAFAGEWMWFELRSHAERSPEGSPLPARCFWLGLAPPPHRVRSGWGISQSQAKEYI
ncbi:MAG: hypothetical protein U9O54_05520 [Chloroflexota bacterium]|nr:hypothetical protein [Chloroflexota bacterium]